MLHQRYTGKSLLIFLVIAVIFIGCSKEEDPEPVTEPEITEYEESVISYFKEVALGFEFGDESAITRKWSSDMRIFVGGNGSPELLQELEQVTAEINELATDGFSVEIVNDTLQSNFYIYLGSAAQYVKIFPYQEEYVKDNWGLFSIWWDENSYIYKGQMYVDTERANEAEQKHLLREELTQSLGLGQDSPLYPESIFQINWTRTTEYTQMDKDLIWLLYHPEMQVGLEEKEVDAVLRLLLL